MTAMLRFRNLPLFGKLLVPGLALTVFLGVFGVFLVVRDLSARAQTALEQDLARRTLDARSILRDRELYLLESVNFAANLEGVSAGIRNQDDRAVARLMQSVLALKTDADLLVATDDEGVGVVEFVRPPDNEDADRASGRDWARTSFIATAFSDDTGAKRSGFVRVKGAQMFAIAAPICTRTARCEAAGVAIAGIRVDALVRAARGAPVPGASQAGLGAAIYNTRGVLLAKDGRAAFAKRAPQLPTAGELRRTNRVGDEEISVLYSALEMGGRRIGTLAVSTPTAPAFASVRGAQFRLGFVLLAAMLAAIALGALMSRLILKQVKPLVETNRALGSGDLSARAPVLSDDEIGELARGVNAMAEQLEAAYETLEMQVAQRTEEIRRLLQERTEFFASMSHELRTPLAIIKGEGKILADPHRTKDPRKIAERAETIVETANQLVTLVNQILDLARAERGSLEVTLQHVDLREALAEMKPTVEGLAKGAGLKASFSIAKGLPPVRADRARLREVLMNLVDNAVKYTPRGGHIIVAASMNGHGVRVTVTDDGIGIDPGAGDKIFEPFFRAKGAEVQNGQPSSGLGLGLAKRLVEAQGGAISYESEPGRGSTFTFWLPPFEDLATR